jgi:hypothetical protein
MCNTLLLDIVQYFVSLGLAEDDGVDCFRDFSPEDPDEVIVIYEYGSSAPTSFDALVKRSVQITTRSRDPDVAREKAIKLYNSLKTYDQANRIDFTSSSWGQVTLRNAPFKIKIDENDRFVYGFNVGIATTVY